MKKRLIFLFLLTSMGCFGQFTKLTVNFSPSFIDKSQVVIEKVNKGYLLSISFSTINEKRTITESSMAELQQLCVNYFQTKQIEDSLETIRKRKAIEELPERLKGLDIVSTSDGWSAVVDLVDKNGTSSIYIRNPGRETINHKLISVVFALMESTFKKPETIAYMNELGRYF